MANLSSSFQQNRAQVLGQKTSGDTITPSNSFAENRAQVLIQSKAVKQQTAKQVKQAPIVKSQPKKKETVFDLVGNSIKNAIKTSTPPKFFDIPKNIERTIKVVENTFQPKAVKEKVKKVIGDPEIAIDATIGVGVKRVVDQYMPLLSGLLDKPENQKKVVEFVKENIRAFPRAVTTTAITAKGEKEFTPKTKAEKIVLGKRTVKDVPGVGEETIKGFGGNAETASKFALPVGLALTTLDLIPGVSKKSIVETIAKETNESVIKTILKTKLFKDIPDEQADLLAKKLAKIEDPKVIEKEIEDLSKGADLREGSYQAQKVTSQQSPDPSLQKLSEEKLPQQQAGKLPTPSDTIASRPKGTGENLSTSVERPETVSSKGLYKETPKITNAIEETAKTVKESPSRVRRVINSLGETKTKIIEYVQNEQERVRKLVARKDVKVDDISDPYLKATLYPGRVATKVQEGKDEAESIIKDSKKIASKFKTDLKSIRKEVNDYLYFRHAPERNTALGEKAAGITTKEAEEGLKALEASPRGKEIKALADRASKLNGQTLDLLHNSGVITDELYNTLRAKYKNHVPLNRIFEETDDVGSVMSGRGFDVRSTGIKSAKGSERQVDDILENIVLNYEQAVIRSEKNIVDQATLAFARNNKDILGDLFEVKTPKMIGQDFSGKFLREKTNDPTILQLFEKGKPVWIKVKDPNLAIALRGVGREKIGVLLNAVGMFTRFYSGLATRFNPEFALPNKIRDLQETAIYLSSQKGVGFTGAAKMATRDLFQQNTKAIIESIAGKDTEGARLYKELKEMGGTTGGFGLSTKDQVKLDLKELEKLANSKTVRIGDNLVKYVDNWNTIFEDSTRLSVYRQALKQGLSKERAAFLAKEASINFNRMGKGGSLINSLWMFSNASIQGTTKMIRALKNPKVLGATLLTVGSSVAAVNQWNDQIDPDWREKVSKWDRLNGLPVVLPNMSGEGVKYFTIPVSWGIKPIKVMSDYAYDAVSGQEFNVKNFTEDTLNAVLEAYNPVGGSDLVSALTPTILDVPAEIARNQSWAGSKIRPDFDPSAPDDIKYFQSLKETKTGQTAISIAEILQSKAGILVSPANIKYAFDSYVGGAGRTISKTVNTITGALGSRSAPIDEYPMVSRFYRERTEEEIGISANKGTPEVKGLLQQEKREKFKLKEKVQPIYDKVQGLKQEGKDEEVQKIVDGLSDEEWEVYKNIKTADKKQENNILKQKMYPVVQRVQKLKQAGKKADVQEIVDDMTDDEYEAYQRAKKELGFE